MESSSENKTPKKGFFAKLFDKLDKKMQEKANSGSCCCKSGDKEGNKTCCS